VRLPVRAPQAANKCNKTVIPFKKVCCQKSKICILIYYIIGPSFTIKNNLKRVEKMGPSIKKPNLKQILLKTRNMVEVKIC